MKICLIGDRERAFMPYMDKYEAILENAGAEVDIISWNHKEKPLYPRDNEYTYYSKRAFMKNKGFKGFVKRLLSKKKYDKVVVFTTRTARILRKYLKKKFDDRYIFDYRDYTHENLKWYLRQVEEIISHSQLTCISSYGFFDYIQKRENIIMNHNISPFEEVSQAPDLNKKSLLNISYLGYIWEFDENSFLIDWFKNKFKYQLWYIGTRAANCDLDEYCLERGITNVSFAGHFDNDEKPELYKNVDIVNSIYGNETFKVTASLPTRLYEACQFKKPILASKGTYLGEITAKFSLGLTVDAELDNVAEMLDKYIEEFNPMEFTKNCNEYLALVREDEKIFAARVAEFAAEQ